MKRILCLIFSLELLLILHSAAAHSTEYTYFSQTQYPLQVHSLKGTLEGNTVLVQGGIQGDERSGYLTAQILTKATVKKGTLIIVPRANLPSVHHRTRQINVDLNRRFDQDYNQFYEDRIARLIKLLLKNCDGFIHLHEGSGFYSPTYESGMRNPNRYGQSVIIDTDVYGEDLFLGKLVQNVLLELNSKIDNTDYHFTLFNTNTFSSVSSYSEQRKSLTYFALQRLGIPAMAIEVSKSILDLEWKVRQQLLATKLFLSSLGVEIELPPLTGESFSQYFKPRSWPLRINGQESIGSGGEVVLEAGQEVAIEYTGDPEPFISPKWAVFASDRPEVNLVDRPRLALYPFSHLSVYQDGEPMGRIKVRWQGKWASTPEPEKPVFVVRLRDRLHYVPAGRTLTALEGQRMVIEGLLQGEGEEILNVKGYVSNHLKNDGQDLGFEIVLDPEVFLSRYLESDNDGWELSVVRETPGKAREGITIRVIPRELRLIKLKDENGSPVYLEWNDGTIAALPPGEYDLVDLWSNGSADDLMLFVNGRHVPWGGRVLVPKRGDAELAMYLSTTCMPMGRMNIGRYETAEARNPSKPDESSIAPFLPRPASEPSRSAEAPFDLDASPTRKLLLESGMDKTLPPCALTPSTESSAISICTTARVDLTTLWAWGMGASPWMNNDFFWCSPRQSSVNGPDPGSIRPRE
ncbi:MAG: M14/M99 family metallopeptidase [Desulfovibrionales bacterium]